MAAALDRVGEVFVVAPSGERSACSHSFSAHGPVLVRHLDERRVAVDGTPTDCVMFAVRGILGRKPDLVVSGINPGANLGDDVTYSGTVAGALEGTLLGIPSFSISLACRKECLFEAAAEFAVRLAVLMLERGLPRGIWLNVNVPANGSIAGIRVTRQGRRVYRDEIVKTVGEDGCMYYQLCGDEPGGEPGRETDLEAIDEGMISITPLKLDLTSHEHLGGFREWQPELSDRDAEALVDGVEPDAT